MKAAVQIWIAFAGMDISLWLDRIALRIYRSERVHEALWTVSQSTWHRAWKLYMRADQ